MSTSETVQRHLSTETSISTDRLRRGRVGDQRLAQAPAGRRTRPRLALPAARRPGRHTQPAARAGPRDQRPRRRPGPRHRRLPAAHAPRQPVRQPRRGRLLALARAEAPGDGAALPGHRSVAAQPRRRAAHRPPAAAVRPARVRQHRSRRRHGPHALPRRLLRRRLTAPRRDRHPRPKEPPRRPRRPAVRLAARADAHHSRSPAADISTPADRPAPCPEPRLLLPDPAAATTGEPRHRGPGA